MPSVVGREPVARRRRPVSPDAHLAALAVSQKHTERGRPREAEHELAVLLRELVDVFFPFGLAFNQGVRVG